MTSNQKGFGLVWIVLIFVVVTMIAAASLIAYRSKLYNREDEPALSYNSSALMVVTSSGGMCAQACKHSSSNLYESGKFEGYKQLSKSEITELKNIIKTTDFTKYAPNPNPQCESFVDGFDQVLLFPQKYGKKSFTTCMLDISKDDPTFNYINQILKTHYIQS